MLDAGEEAEGFSWRITVEPDGSPILASIRPSDASIRNGGLCAIVDRLHLATIFAGSDCLAVPAPTLQEPDDSASPTQCWS